MSFEDSIRPTRLIGLKVWWAYFWRTLLCVLVVSMLIGLLVGVIGHTILGMEPARVTRLVDFLSPFFAFGLMIGVSAEMMRRTLKKKFKDFEIIIVPKKD